MKKFIQVSLAFLFILSTTLTVHAYNEPQLIQAFMKECNIDVFLSGDLDEQSLSVKVANTETDIIDCGIINKAKILTRTTILVDISNSVPVASRDKVANLLEYQVENIAENEEIRIITFGNEVKILQKFTSDRYDLYKALEQIVYNGTQSVVYDAIHNTIPELEMKGEVACFYRTIVVTDGADHTASGITKEELLMKLQSTTYPIDVVCVNKIKPKNPNKDLSALTRISNGRYYDIYPDSDIKQLHSELSINDYYWIRASIPYKYLDGSTRQIDVQDDKNHISFDIKMSVVDYNPTEKSDIQTTATEESVSTATEITYILPDDVSEENNFALILLIIGVVIILSIIIIVVVFLCSRKKPVDNIATTDIPKVSADTELYEEYSDNEIYVIKMSDVLDANSYWTLEVPGEIIIGRSDNCDITLTDKSVSHEQCKIAIRTNGLTVQNLSKSNHTKLNGNKVNEETLLHSSDTLHFGRVTLRIDSIQKIGAVEKKTNTNDKNKYPPTDVLFD